MRTVQAPGDPLATDTLDRWAIPPEQILLAALLATALYIAYLKWRGWREKHAKRYGDADRE